MGNRRRCAELACLFEGTRYRRPAYPSLRVTPGWQRSSSGVVQHPPEEVQPRLFSYLFKPRNFKAERAARPQQREVRATPAGPRKDGFWDQHPSWRSAEMLPICEPVLLPMESAPRHLRARYADPYYRCEKKPKGQTDLCASLGWEDPLGGFLPSSARSSIGSVGDSSPLPGSTSDNSIYVEYGPEELSPPRRGDRHQSFGDGARRAPPRRYDPEPDVHPAQGAGAAQSGGLDGVPAREDQGHREQRRVHGVDVELSAAGRS